MRTGMTLGVLSRRGLLSVLVVLLMTASTAHAESDSIERIRSVPSPYTYFDPVDDNGWDLTAVQVRNGPNQVVLRFWMRWPYDGLNRDTVWAIFDLDLKINGINVDYKVGVGSGYVSVRSVHRPTGNPDCMNPGVSDLGSNRLGHGFAARFAFRCIGGRHTFRIAASTGFWNDVDRAPDAGFTPYIRPRT
jgi:hypothetical protein